MLIARITDLLSHTWNIPIVDKMISIWFSMRVSLVKISGCRGMFTEWLVEPKGVWSAQPGGCAGIAHTWFFETSCGIQTMQSQKLESMNPTQHHQYPWFLGPKLSCTSWTRWSFSFQACQARWVSCFSISCRWGVKRQAIGSLLTDNFYFFSKQKIIGNISHWLLLWFFAWNDFEQPWNFSRFFFKLFCADAKSKLTIHSVMESPYAKIGACGRPQSIDHC